MGWGLFRVRDNESSEHRGETTGAVNETEEGAGGIGAAEEVYDMTAAISELLEECGTVAVVCWAAEMEVEGGFVGGAVREAFG